MFHCISQRDQGTWLNVTRETPKRRTFELWHPHLSQLFDGSSHSSEFLGHTFDPKSVPQTRLRWEDQGIQDSSDLKLFCLPLEFLRCKGLSSPREWTTKRDGLSSLEIVCFVAFDCCLPNLDVPRDLSFPFLLRVTDIFVKLIVNAKTMDACQWSCRKNLAKLQQICYQVKTNFKPIVASWLCLRKPAEPFYYSKKTITIPPYGIWSSKSNILFGYVAEI